MISRGTMRRTLLVILAILCVTAQAVTRSQSGTPQRPAVDITNAEIRATIKTAPTDAVTICETSLLRMPRSMLSASNRKPPTKAPIHACEQVAQDAAAAPHEQRCDEAGDEADDEKDH